jgi:hypothetical protein
MSHAKWQNLQWIVHGTWMSAGCVTTAQVSRILVMTLICRAIGQLNGLNSGTASRQYGARLLGKVPSLAAVQTSSVKADPLLPLVGAADLFDGVSGNGHPAHVVCEILRAWEFRAASEIDCVVRWAVVGCFRT